MKKLHCLMMLCLLVFATKITSENQNTILKNSDQCKVSLPRNYFHGVRSFPHSDITEKINESKQGNITTVLESMIDSERNYCMIEHTIKDLSLEDATKLRNFYNDCTSVVRDNKSTYYCTDDAQCAHQNETIFDIKRRMLINSGTFIAAALILTNALRQYIPKHDYLDKDAQINRMKKTWKVFGGLMTIAFLSVLTWPSIMYLTDESSGTVKDSLFHKDLCEYKHKVIAALDEKISELQHTE